MMLLVAVALTAISTAGVTILHRQLLDRTDFQLSTVAGAYPHTPLAERPPGGGAGGSAVFQIQRRDADGKPVQDGCELADGTRTWVLPATRDPAIPEDPAWLEEHAGHPVTVPASTGGSSWRVLVQPLADM
ncbi:hypothetical protein ACQPZP_31365 [Spirillospora sp. CA-142024]|uniref:hypothetical protein n=1 Tax=Spirillospora sp. CA-142024 TaxID=3240036 RepID=UPI003D8AE7F1